MGNRDRQSKEVKKQKKDTKVSVKSPVQAMQPVTVLRTKGKKPEQI